ncbi:MAG: hypothetical protein E7387_07125 [Ruminococcaceae bacterium]|nr:hypothetical protein [Oscillospiraceae bacterium]
MKKNVVAITFICIISMLLFCVACQNDKSKNTEQATATIGNINPTNSDSESSSTESILGTPNVTTNAGATDTEISATPIIQTPNVSGEAISSATAIPTSAPEHLVTSSSSGNSTVTIAPNKTATPNPTNTPKPTPQVPTVDFSKDGGIYTKAFELKLTADPGYTIYYTTDGSDPLVNGKKYLAPITIQNSMGPAGNLTKNIARKFSYNAPSSQLVGTVIKAYAVNGNKSTDVVTNSYVVNSNFTSEYKLPTVSISLKPSDFATNSGIYVSVMSNPFGTKERKTAFFELFDRSGKKVAGQYAELSMHGNGSLGNQQKSMRIYFKKDANPAVSDNPGKLKYDVFEGRVFDCNNVNIDSYKRLILRNSGNDCTSSMLRDALMQRICKDTKVDYMETQPAAIFINGEFWGLYNIRERYDTKYFESHYGISEENFVMLEAPSPLVTGNENSPYEVNDGAEGDEKPFNNLVSYAKTHNLSNESYYNYVANQLDIDSLIDFYICNIYFCNVDWPSNNVKVWRNKNPQDPGGLDTKWRFVLLDMDHGCSYVNDYKFNMMNRCNGGTVLSDLMKALIANNNFKQKFINRFNYLMDNVFVSSKMLPVLDKMSNEIEPIISLHSQRWNNSGISYQKWNTEISKIREFLTNRTTYAKKHFNEYFNLVPRTLEITVSDGISSVTANSKTISNNTISYSAGEKITLKASIKSGYSFAGIIVTTQSGQQTIYTSNSATITPAEKLSVSVLARKNNFSTTESLVTGSRNLFYLKSNGDLYAWGASDKGQCGVLRSSNMLPVSLIMTGVKQVATSQGGNVGDDPHTLILTADNSLYAVGNNNYGQTGYNADEYYILRKVSSVPSGTIKEIAAGYDHSLILMSNGDLYGIGNNEKGQLGTKNYGSKLTTFTKMASNVSSMAAGRRHSLYVTNGKLFALGDNRWKKLTSSSTESYKTPVQVTTKNISKVFAGEHSSFCIDTDGNLYYFGWRNASSFVTGEGDGQLHKIMSNVASLSMQDEHAIIITNDKKVYGWGLNSYNQISTSSYAASFATPQLISNSAKAGAAGSWFSAILNNDGSITVWGKNEYGISGTGSTSNKISKTTIAASKFNK